MTREQMQGEVHDLEERLAHARRIAAQRGVDISSNVRVIEARLRRIERQLRDGRLDDREAA